MLDIAYIREHPQEVENNARNRGHSVDIHKVLEYDAKRSAYIVQIDALRAKQNAHKGTPTPAQLSELSIVKEKEASLSRELDECENILRALLSEIPNLSHPDVHISTDENDNPLLDVVKEPITFDFEPKDHVVLGESLDLIDFDRATKVSGAKFYYLKNDAVLLEQALIAYAFQIVTRHGYIPIIT
ncbi:serine--tRNA ligase, partial [Candidatus Berkelbacteria bacterium]|nr:serine--tRNA ligase [Candidatus Berkelbacteria bacterium]